MKLSLRTMPLHTLPCSGVQLATVAMPTLVQRQNRSAVERARRPLRGADFALAMIVFAVVLLAATIGAIARADGNPPAPAPHPAVAPSRAHVVEVRHAMAAPMHCAPAVVSNLGTKVQYCSVGGR